MPATRMYLATILLVLFSMPGLPAEEPDSSGSTLITFYAMGDVPYKPEEDRLLPQQIAELPDDGLFVIHVGDIKGGSAPCDEAVFQKVSGMLSKSRTPVFIIPGDNEWNDCTDPAQAWTFWNQYFRRFDRRWEHDLPVFRQIEHEENLSFVANGVLVIGINLVGGHVHDPAEWKQRHADNLDWIQRNLNQFGDDIHCLVLLGHAHPKAAHDDFFRPFEALATEFGRPVLYLHGDGHNWMHDRPFAAKNILRVQVDQGGKAPPLKVTITDHATTPFQFDRRLPAAAEQP